MVRMIYQIPMYTQLTSPRRRGAVPTNETRAWPPCPPFFSSRSCSRLISSNAIFAVQFIICVRGKYAMLTENLSTPPRLNSRKEKGNKKK